VPWLSGKCQKISQCLERGNPVNSGDTCAIKYIMTATRALVGGILKILIFSEILPVLIYLSVAVIADKYCILGRVQAAIENWLPSMKNLPLWATEYTKLACRIWKNLPRKTVLWRHSVVVSALSSINVVNRDWARLVLDGWPSVGG